MPNGYNRKILHADLTSGDLWIEEPDEAFYRHYMGGSNFGLYYLLNHMPAGADPLGPDNVLTLMLSVLTGAPFSGQSRVTASAKSPLTGGIGDSQAGGFFPAEFKFAGFDGAVIYGRAETPVYLWLHNGEAELRDARELWGLGAWDTETAIRAELEDDRIEVACIGPGGENLVRLAAIINMRNRACGRTGMGAVMGSKNLKAVAVRGQVRVEVADQKAIKRIAAHGAKELKANPDMDYLAEFGTAGVVMPQQFAGGLPTRNYQSGHFEGAEAISGERMAETILVDRDTCYACVVRCKRVVEAHRGEPIGDVQPELGGPEYESAATFGSYCEIDDLVAISKANALCNDYGLDTIACGATIAWAMECFEDGLLDSEGTDGLDLRFGNAEAMVEAVERVAHRRGRLGDLLAEGSAAAAVQIGPEAEERVVAVKGSELPAHMPQVKRSMGLIYAVNPFGADHQSSEHDPMYHPKPYEGKPENPGYKRFLSQIGLHRPQPTKVLNDEKVEFALKTQYTYAATDTISLCQFVFGPAWQLYGPQEMADLLAASTGWTVTVDDIQEIGRRRLNMMRAFNAREGIARDADTLPRKLFRKALEGGRTDGMTLDETELEVAIDQYCEQAGWDVATGIPTRSALEDVGLAWVADELEGNKA